MVNLRDVTRNRTFDPDYQMCLEECEKIFGTVGIILIQSKGNLNITRPNQFFSTSTRTHYFQFPLRSKPSNYVNLIVER